MANFDMLVKLYDFKKDDLLIDKLRSHGIIIKRALPPEMTVVCDFIRENFGQGWADEATSAMLNKPSTCFIALKDRKVVGFACSEATNKGFFGPTGVHESVRGNGVGTALLHVTLNSMYELGYAYAVIGSVGPAEYYKKACGAVVIEGSDPGIYRDMVSSD